MLTVLGCAVALIAAAVLLWRVRARRRRMVAWITVHDTDALPYVSMVSREGEDVTISTMN